MFLSRRRDPGTPPPLLLFALLFIFGAACSPEPAAENPATPSPSPTTVETIRPPIERLQPSYSGLGRLEPGAETTIAAQVAASVVYVSDDLFPGRILAEGSTLLRLDATDFELAVVQARAEVDAARLAVRMQEAEAEIAVDEHDRVGHRADSTSDLALRQPQLIAARSRLDAAQAALDRALHDVRRTVIRAPRRCRIRHRHVEPGRWVERGAPLLTLQAADFIELRLPMPPELLTGLEPETTARIEPSQGRPRDAALHRIEDDLDPATGLGHAVFRVLDPFDGPAQDRLSPGALVQARVIGGPPVEVVRLPSSALVDGQVTLIQDDAPPRRVTVRPVERRASWVAVALEGRSGSLRDAEILRHPADLDGEVDSATGPSFKTRLVPWSDLGFEPLPDLTIPENPIPEPLLEGASPEPTLAESGRLGTGPPESAEPGTEAAGPWPRVKSWTAEPSAKDGLELRVRLDAPAGPTAEGAVAFRVDAPSRWVVDIAGLLHDEGPQDRLLDSPTFLRVRSAQNRLPPSPVTRWAVTFTGAVAEPQVDAVGLEIRIRFGDPEP